MQRQADGDDADDGAGGPGAGIERRTGIVAGDGFAFVSHTGEVFPSGFLPESAGNVRDRSITELYRDSSLFQSLRDRDQLSGKWGLSVPPRLRRQSLARVCPHRRPTGERSALSVRSRGYDGPLPWNDTDGETRGVSSGE